jgi:PAS domain S-box-containing protein
MKKPIEKKEKMVAKLIAANKELVLQNKEMSQQTTELMVVNKELKQIKETLLLSESRYRRLFETAKDGIIILDAETGLILDVNPFLIEKLGYSKEQFIDKEIWEIGFFNDIIENQDRFLELQQKEYVRYEDLPLKTIDGRQLNVEFISNVYLENTHKVIQCNIRDITERKVTEVELNNYRNHLEFLVKERTEKLEIAIQTKNKFFSIIAHDLRNPFHALIGLSRISLTQIKNREYENLKMQVSMIHEATKNGYALLENLLEWASLQLGQIEVKKEVFNVWDMII